MPDVTVAEYAARHAVSPQTVKRRLKSGALAGYRVDTPQGFIWHINDTADDTPVNGAQSELVAFLQEQLVAKDSQIGILLDQLREANTRLALPAPANGQPWWKQFWPGHKTTNSLY